MFNINQGFSLKSAQFNFERDYFKDLATLKAADLSWFPNYFITNVSGTLYQLDKSNSDDKDTGKWRKFSATSDAVSSSLTDLVDRVDKAENNISNNDNDISLLKEDVTDIIATLDEKVTKVNGKGLSTNDYTTDEKNKLAGLSNYTHPASAAGAKTSGLYKIATDANGHVTAATAVQKSDITALGIPAQDTTYSVATASANGLMSAADKKKYDSLSEAIVTGVEGDANDDNFDINFDIQKVNNGVYSDSTPVTVRIDAASTKGAGVMSVADKTKLDAVAAGATADSAISDTEIDTIFNSL